MSAALALLPAPATPRPRPRHLRLVEKRCTPDPQVHPQGALGVRNDTASTGLLYMQERYYAPDLARFLNRDPIGFRGGLNQYAYVDNNPINLVDPTGLYGFVYDVHGKLLANPKTPKEFYDYLRDKNTQNCSIGRVAIYGHANIDLMSFDAKDSDATNGTMFTRAGRIWLSFLKPKNPAWKDPGAVDITDLLRSKLSPQARIDLGGCDTAGHSKDPGAFTNAQNFSAILQRSVIGNYGEAWPIKQDDSGGEFKRFTNGKLDPNFARKGFLEKLEGKYDPSSNGYNP